MQEGEQFDMDLLTSYERRVIAQITDEESRMYELIRILPDKFDHPGLLGQTYLNDMCVDWLKHRKNLINISKEEL